MRKIQKFEVQWKNCSNELKWVFLRHNRVRILIADKRISMNTKEDKDDMFERATECGNILHQLFLVPQTKEQLKLRVEGIKKANKLCNIQARPVTELCQKINRLLNEKYEKKLKETEVIE